MIAVSIVDDGDPVLRVTEGLSRESVEAWVAAEGRTWICRD